MNNLEIAQELECWYSERLNRYYSKEALKEQIRIMEKECEEYRWWEIREERIG